MRKTIFTICFMLLTACAFSQVHNNRVAFPRDVMFRDTVYFGNGTDSIMVFVHNDTAWFSCVTCAAYSFVQPVFITSRPGTNDYTRFLQSADVSGFAFGSITTRDSLFNYITETRIGRNSSSGNGNGWYAKVSSIDLDSIVQLSLTKSNMTFTFNGVTQTFPNANAAGYMKNNGSGTLSYAQAYSASDTGLVLATHYYIFHNALSGDASGIPEYPDNTTAVAAIGAGRLYFTTVSGEHIVKITY
jgi:hypothetical protein